MKSILTLLILSTIVAGFAQQPPQAAPVPRPPPVTLPVPSDVVKTVNDSVRLGFGVAEEAVAASARLAARALPGLEDVEMKLQDLRPYASGRGNRTLLIHSTAMDAATASNAEEDLAIMARILDKAVRSSPDDGRRFASGIEVDGGVFGSSSGARNMVLEGYGALFLLSVKFPLIAPPEKPEAPKVKDTPSDDWNKARDEIQGSLRGGTDPLFDSWPSAASRGPAEEFDADRVEKLEDSILESLKNATHIRALKPNEFITVVVQGGDVARADVKRVRTTATDKADPNHTAYTVVRKTGGAGQSVMTIRVKKSDADDFARGRLTPDEFRKKAAIQTYFRKSDAGSAANFFMQPVR